MRTRAYIFTCASGPEKHGREPCKTRHALTQTKKENLQLISLDCRFSTYAHYSAGCQLINQKFQNFTYLLSIASRWYCTV